MRFKYIKCSLIASVCLVAFVTRAQSLPPFSAKDTTYQSISLNVFLKDLNEKNPTIKVRKLGIDSADSIAKQAGKPLLSPILTYARGSYNTQTPYTGYASPASNTVGASITVEGWGKRSAREAFAQAEANRNLADMVTESRSIETQAILSYVDALRTKLLWQSYQGAIDRLGSIKQAEATKQKANFETAQKVLANDLKFYAYGLMGYLNVDEKTLPLPMGTLDMPPQSFQIDKLITQAQENRVDITSGKAYVDSASTNLELVKANRNVDFLPGIYYTETPPYSSSGIAYGTQKSASFLLSIPLGNGLLIDSDVIAASNSVAEQEVNLMATKTKIVTEINQTYLQYQSAKERLESAIQAYKQSKITRIGSLKGVLAFRDAEYELIDARTVHAKTLILLQRLSGNFEVPNLN